VKLPVGWVSAPIGEICDLFNGMAFKPSDWSKSGLPIIRIQNLNRIDAEFNFCDKAVEDRFIVEPGDLLFAWSGTPGTSFGAHIWNGPRAVLNQHIFRVQHAEADIDRAFFRRAINAKLEELIEKAHGGVGLRHVTKGKFEATEIVLPPLAEQRRIVAKLDALTSRLGRARAELDRISALARRLREQVVEKSLSFQEGRGRGWVAKPLGEIAMDGPTNGWSPKSENGAQGALTLKLSATTSGRLRLDAGAIKRIHEVPPATSKFWLKSGDLLVQRANSLEHVGATAIFDGPSDQFIYPDLMMRLRFVDPRQTRLIWYKLNSPTVRRFFRENATGTAGNMPKISGRTLSSLLIALPPSTEWDGLLARLDAAFARADRLEAEAARARALLDRLEATILARAFRGELVPQDPNDEPASAILARIRQSRDAAPKAKRGRKGKELA
jgi:type I restriction enzyme, S subunit